MASPTDPLAEAKRRGEEWYRRGRRPKVGNDGSLPGNHTSLLVGKEL